MTHNHVNQTFSAYMCPDGLEYDANRQVPLPSCLDRNPTSTGTQRGCFCPEGQFLQDGACVEPDQCRCLHEGVFYNVSILDRALIVVFMNITIMMIL